ncbi:TetR/AcrR family transcriptional regulator [Thalassotalea fusca]
MTNEKSSYHHGDLKQTLLDAATEMINIHGIEQLSLRKLAESVGVSRTAAYHHFADKNDLLCAIASQGFCKWREQTDQLVHDTTLSTEDKYRAFVHQYLKFATENANTYDLMFGRAIWKDNNSTEELRSVAYPCFDYQVTMAKQWQAQGLLPNNEQSLRLAQVIWGTLHGIARLIIDGIYTDASNITEMGECAVRLLLSKEKL